MLDVVALGELLIDFACIDTDKDGYPTMAAHPGGAPANFLATLAKYGHKTALLGKVGDDTFGKLLIGTLKNAGIETQGIVSDPDCFTTLAFVTIDKSGNREFAFARKPGADTRICPKEMELSLIEQAKIFHFGSLSLTDEPARTATRQAVAYAKSAKKLITYDPNLRKPLWSDLAEAKNQILWGLKQADVVKISDDEVEFLWNYPPEEGADKLLDFGVSLAMVTLGAKGAYLTNRNGGCFVQNPQVQPIDTTGAGDIFGGSAISRILELNTAPRDLTLEQLRAIGTFAVTAAGISTETSGGIPSIPSLETVLRSMA